MSTREPHGTARPLKSRRVPDEKRKRAAQACDRCKARKSKCVGVDTGRCQRCTRDDRVCNVTKYYSGVSPMRSGSTSPRRTRTTVDGVSEPAGFKTLEASVDISNSAVMKITWPRFLLQLREALALDPRIELEESDMMAMQTQYHQPTILQPNEIKRIHKASRALPPRAVADFLICVCLTHASDVFFYLDQSQFLADVDQFYNQPASPLRLDSGFVCLILSVLALGSQWTELERPSSFSANLLPDDREPGRVFFEEARSLIPDLMDRTSLTSIQAPFILGVYSLPDRALGSAYSYMGLALRKAVALEIHQQGDDSRFSEHEIQVRCRTWWSVYSLERTTAIKLNRPRSIDPADITTPLPVSLPSLDHAQAVDNIQHQIAYASLVMILDRIADQGTKARHGSQIDTLQLELETWKRNLPPALRVENIRPKDADYRAVVHLQLNYLYAWIVLGKGSLLNTIQAHVRRQRPDADTVTHIRTGPSTVLDDLALSCVEASKMILSLCESLSRNNLTFRFSFTDFQGCSIATIVAILAGIVERDAQYEARVAFGLNHLRTMALGNLPAEVGVRFVETLQAISNEAFAKLGNVGASGDEHYAREARHEDRNAAGYSQWAQWVSSKASLNNTDQGRDLQFEVPNSSFGPVSTLSTTTSLAQTSASAISSDHPPAHQDLSNMVAMDSPLPLDIDPQMVWSHDDQLALMGLTGLDMLEFDISSVHPNPYT
ncbi:Zn(II)2Cys6 transcription factor [Aspergillus mulundensis]|uniref:Putative Zn(II)2Cys6 transcription factor n=1 Tax=Aspergillus mulundensis TaxID=1810919 RepID=A0A3D8RQV1_9EURO|nr:putative Zn(II)2Cys6 transcription factor [Aspergillus mulundensis]RDW76467.1 putative Zn(II)2Cys6 transcription factor [Aspergillus mulundensis]